MFAVLVDFEIKSGFETQFKEAVIIQAENSLNKEVDCSVFDVCFDQNDNSTVFLYELYTDADAFDTHLKSDHFKSFDALVADWITGKSVRILVRV